MASAAERLPFYGNHRQVDDLGQSHLVGRAVKAFVHAGALDLGEARVGLFNQRDGNLIVRDLLHHLVVKNKAVLVFAHSHAQPQLDGHTGLAFVDPFDVGLEEAEKTFCACAMRSPRRTRRRI